jgi:hypothetical protein
VGQFYTGLIWINPAGAAGSRLDLPFMEGAGAPNAVIADVARHLDKE